MIFVDGIKCEGRFIMKKETMEQIDVLAGISMEVKEHLLRH